MVIKLTYLIPGTVFMLLTWLFVGIFRDDEFYEPALFTKHKPTFKVNFYSPIGMQSIELKDLSADKQLEEVAFQEFVMDQHQQNNSHAKLWYVPFILIQLTLTSFTFGLYGSLRRINFKKWHLPVHLIANLILTSIGIGFILALDNIISTIVLALILIAINYGTVFILTRQKRHE